jgi:hypothetical protein
MCFVDERHLKYNLENIPFRNEKNELSILNLKLLYMQGASALGNVMLVH